VNDWSWIERGAEELPDDGESCSKCATVYRRWRWDDKHPYGEWYSCRCYPRVRTSRQMNAAASLRGEAA
jgi:hypothetical protein